MSQYWFQQVPPYPARPKFYPYGEPSSSAKELSERAVRRITPKSFDVCVKKLRYTNIMKRGGVCPPAQWVLVWKERVNGVVKEHCSSDTGCIMVAEIALGKAAAKGAKIMETV